MCWLWRFGLKLSFMPLLRRIFPIWRHSSSRPPKGPSLGGNTSFEPFSVRISSTVIPGRVNEKKIQDNKKVTKVLYFPYLGEAPARPIRPKSCVVGDVLDIITCAKFQIEIFMGYDFTGGRIFNFLIDFCMGLTTVQALPVSFEYMRYIRIQSATEMLALQRGGVLYAVPTMRLASFWISCTVISLFQWKVASDILMTLAIKCIHNLPPHLTV